jgi:hypothetical protein
MLEENAVLQSLFVILSNLQLIMNLFAFSLKFRAYTRFRALLEIPRKFLARGFRLALVFLSRPIGASLDFRTAVIYAVQSGLRVPLHFFRTLFNFFLACFASKIEPYHPTTKVPHPSVWELWTV